MQFCPLCLRDDGQSPYFRRHWRLGLNCICEKHGCFLRGHCPHCGEPIAYFRHDLNQLSASTNDEMASCWRCHFDLRDSVAEYPVFGEDLAGWLREVMDTANPMAGFLWTSSAMSLAYYQGILVLIRVLSSKHGAELRRHLLHEIGYPGDIRFTKARQLFSELPISERLGLLLATGYLLQDWPERFVSSCRQYHVRRSNFIELFHLTPWWLYDAVTSHFDGRIYMFSPEEIGSAIRYLEQQDKSITIRNLRKFIGMTQNAAVAVKNAYQRDHALRGITV